MDESLAFDRYFNLSLRFLSYRPRSEKEVFDYLKKKSTKAPSLSEHTIARIMARLIELKFINDLEFARFWITNRKKGLRILKIELSQKGISRDIIDNVLSEFDTSVKEEDLIKKLIKKKKKSLTKENPRKAFEKMVAFLLRKGFDYDFIKKHLNDVEF